MALNGDVGCRAIFGDHSDGIRKVAVGDVGILLDIDNKHDFTTLRQYRAGVQEIDHQFDAVDLSNRIPPENDASSQANNNLVLVGSEPVVVALAKLARILQFRVTLVDPLLRASDLPEAHEVLNSLDLSHIPGGANCYMVIASRGRFDEEAIEQAFEADVGYVALVANRKRADEVRRRLEEKGHAPKKLARLRSPAGLDIGANTAQEIALSIMAEIVYASRKVAKGRLL
jgi:xanthine/CO dehydrogenase XdhC/CoxF family maturation factor